MKSKQLIIISICLFWLFLSSVLWAADDPPKLAWRLLAEYPHNPASFTQGLLFDDGFLYESVGQFGRSALLKIDPASGRELKRENLSREHFGEGLALVGSKLFQLTWNTHKIFVYDKSSFRPLGDYPLPGEGWGLAFDGRRLLLSDGTDVLRLLRPGDLVQTGQISVTWQGRPLTQLNELEYVDGYVYANIWHANSIAVISPKSGEVEAWLDLAPLAAKCGPLGPESVLNGIAYNPVNRHFYLTGKYWPKLFEIELDTAPLAASHGQ